MPTNSNADSPTPRQQIVRDILKQEYPGLSKLDLTYNDYVLTPSTTMPPVRAAFRQIKDRADKEDELLIKRHTALLTFNGFMFALYGLALKSTVDVENHTKWAFASLLFFSATISIVVNGLFYSYIKATYTALSRLHLEWIARIIRTIEDQDIKLIVDSDNINTRINRAAAAVNQYINEHSLRLLGIGLWPDPLRSKSIFSGFQVINLVLILTWALGAIFGLLFVVRLIRP